MKSPFMPEPYLSVFVIETATPTVSTVVAEHDPRGYGENGADWRPFLQQELPLAEYARQAVGRLGFNAKVSGIKTASDPCTRRPGIILIDPWFIADDAGRLALESAVKNLPRWVLPLIILNQPNDTDTKKLASQVREILHGAWALPTDSSRRAAMGVSSLDDFVFAVRLLATEAERQYMRYRSGRHQSGQVPSLTSGTRPSLHRSARPVGLGSRPDQLAETPDA